MNIDYTRLIKEQIAHMRQRGFEPEHVAVRYDLWDRLGRPGTFAGVCCYPDNKVLGNFEVR